jgi:TonB family protein
MATGHVETLTRTIADPPVNDELEFELEQQPPDSPDIETPTPPDSADPDFVDEHVTAVSKPVRERKPVRMMKPAGTTPARFGSAKSFVINSPRPAYPYEARRRNMTGAGAATLTIDSTSGRVVDVVMSQSTGSAILDSATTDSLRRWQFKSGCPMRVRVPITFTLTGAVY